MPPACDTQTPDFYNTFVSRRWRPDAPDDHALAHAHAHTNEYQYVPWYDMYYRRFPFANGLSRCARCCPNDNDNDRFVLVVNARTDADPPPPLPTLLIQERLLAPFLPPSTDRVCLRFFKHVVYTRFPLPPTTYLACEIHT